MGGLAQRVTQESEPRASRSSNKRGPGPARTRVGKPAPDAIPAGGAGVDDADQRLVNYQRHFITDTKSQTYFRATRSLVSAARRWRKVANERVKAVGQTMARWETLFLVGFSGEDLTQGELARLISVEGPTMVRMLDVLARDGLIERRQGDTDRRVTTNRITPKGTQVIGDVMDVINTLRVEVLEDIDPEKLDTCVDVLTQIIRKLDEMR